MIGTYKLITGITVTHKVGSNDDSEIVSQFSSSSPTCLLYSKLTIDGDLVLVYIYNDTS